MNKFIERFNKNLAYSLMMSLSVGCGLYYFGVYDTISLTDVVFTATVINVAMSYKKFNS